VCLDVNYFLFTKKPGGLWQGSNLDTKLIVPPGRAGLTA